MANSNGWGDGAANNTIGWGQAANNLINWGKSHFLSWAGRTNIVGSTQEPGGTAPPQVPPVEPPPPQVPPQATAPFVVTNPTLSANNMCANSANSVTINNMVWGGSPTPVITYSWYQVNPLGTDFNDFEIGQYTNTLYLDFSYVETYLYCIVTATNSAGSNAIQTPQVVASDCS